MRVILATIVCRLLRIASRITGKGGTAMPGRIALKLCPSLLSVLAKDVNIVCVTGTNGKTTCCRIIEKALQEAGCDVMANRSGANLISGVTTEFVMNSSLTGKCRRKYAVIECDEAAARRVFPFLQPKVIVVTNLFRDQLDRYGEVMTTLANIRAGISGAPGAKLCLNADCSLTSSLAEDLPNDHVFYGFEKGAVENAVLPEISDATHCIRCKTKYDYDYVTYGHLGAYRCPKCGYSRKKADYGIKTVSFHPDRTDVEILTPDGIVETSVNLPAVYNVYNAAAAFSAATELGIKTDAIIRALGSFRCGFGRMEKFALGKQGGRMILFKNPAGCNQTVEYLKTIKDTFTLVVCLNDRSADGTDISWIWDADFEKLSCCSIDKVVVSGDRALDLAVRLKYAGIPAEKIAVETDYEVIVSSLESCEVPVYLMSTYTAMLELRAVVVAHCGGTDFWEG